jgi:hypothetical protein
MSSTAPISEPDAFRARGWYPSSYRDRSGKATVMFWDGEAWGPFAYRADSSGTKPRPRDRFGVASLALSGAAIFVSILLQWSVLPVETAGLIWPLSFLAFLAAGVLGGVGFRRAHAAHYRASLSLGAGVLGAIAFVLGVGLYAVVMAAVAQL